MTLDSLPISPPLSAGQSTYSNAHQVRLRQACDGCTAAKVKCDKGRPACQRCLDIDEVCQYSPSRRHGKRAKRSRNSPHETTPPLLTRESGLVPPQPSAAGPECSFTPHSADLFAWDSLDPISSTTETMPAFPSEHEQPDLISNLLMWTNFDSPTSLPSRNPSSCLNAQAPSIEREPSEGDEAMSSDAVSWQSFEHPKQETEHALKCEARALDVLKSLQYSPSFCTLERRDSVSAATSNSTTNNSLQRLTCSGDSMDTLLATNKAALGELTRMLECRCADSPHVALLHLTILSKIVFWYRVAVTARYNSQMVDLKPMKIQFGVLDLDDDDYATLHRAILCRELQKAGNAIRAFETRFATSAMPVCNKESPWGRPVIRAIREELERSIHEIDRRQIKPF